MTRDMKRESSAPAPVFSRWVLAGSLALAAVAGGEAAPHLNSLHRGGMPGHPVITSITTASNQVTVTWQGFLGGAPIAPFKLLGCQSLSGGSWQPLASVYSNRATVALQSAAFFQVTGEAAEYAGAAVCATCHTNQHTTWLSTRHAGALVTLQRIGQGNNAACLPCHTVGYDMPTGYTNALAQPLLGGVQCENCHGPAALHAANPRDLTTRPRKEVAAQLCGGCHSVAEIPTYQEWQTSGHAAKFEEDLNPANRINSCGRCHSATARLALLKGEDPAQTVAGDANVSIVCVTCHDPHVKGASPAQTRNPLRSTHDYSLSTSDVFTNKYDPTVNLCAQCHNHRGANWTSGTRPPHHSPQYNVLIGTVGLLTTGAAPQLPGAHALMVTNQCVDCHMHMQPAVHGPMPVPAVTGHNFGVESHDSCRACHPVPELLTDYVMGSVSNRLQRAKYWLDQWAVTKADPRLRKYGARAWEYTNPGELSNPPGVTNAGPTTAEQAYIPDPIKKARFNLYLIRYDGSYGVHNGPFAATLLEAAERWIQEELLK